MTLPRVKHIVASNCEGRLERGFSWFFFHLSLRSDQSHDGNASRAGSDVSLIRHDTLSRFQLLVILRVH